MISRQKEAEQAVKRLQLLQENQPLADRYAEAMITRKYSGSLSRATSAPLGRAWFLREP